MKTKNQRRIGVLMADRSNPFWIGMERHYTRLSPALGINPQYFRPVPAGDPEAQARMLLDMLPLGFDLIILNPLNNRNLAPGILAAANRQVPLLDVGAKTNQELVKDAGSCYLPVPTVDFYEQGRLGAQHICDQLKAGKACHLAILAGRPDSAQSIGRSRGASDCFNSYPGIQSIRIEQADFDRQKARTVSKGLFEKDPGIEAFFCVNDLMALGVADTVEELKLKKSPIIVGVDLIDEAREAIKKGKINASVAFSRREVAVSILKLALEYMETRQPPRIAPVLSHLVCRDNVGISMIETMTSRERLTALKRGDPLDRVPVMAYAGAYTARLAGLDLKTFYTNIDQSVRVQRLAKSLHGYDDDISYGWADWGGGWEFGGKIRFPESYEECAPVTIRNPVAKPGDVDKLKIPDIRTAGMVPNLLALNRIVPGEGSPARIRAGSVTSVVAGIIGRERLMRWYIREPEAVRVVYEKATRFILELADLILDEFGGRASASISAPMDSNDLISGDTFRSLAFPWLKEEFHSERNTSLLVKQIRDAVISFNEKKCAELCRQVIDEDTKVNEVINHGLAAGMETAGVLYEKREYFVPELLLCSDAFNTGLEILQPHITAEVSWKKGRILLGVVQGDIHDIGKSLVKTMLASAGWEVHDLGRDVSNEIFIKAIEEIRPDIVGLSALITTSMMAMPEIIRDIQAIFPGIRIFVGGAPLSPVVAERIGADGYGRDMVAAVREAERLINK